MKIKKGDTVIVLSGNDAGKTGEVTRHLPGLKQVVVSGINIRTRHRKPSGPRRVSGREKREQPIDVSNVAHLRPGSKSAGTRVGFIFRTKDSKKIRVARQAGDKEIKS